MKHKLFAKCIKLVSETDKYKIFFKIYYNIINKIKVYSAYSWLYLWWCDSLWLLSDPTMELIQNQAKKSWVNMQSREDLVAGKRGCVFPSHFFSDLLIQKYVNFYVFWIFQLPFGINLYLHFIVAGKSSHFQGEFCT